MRLTQVERDVIVGEARRCFGPEVRVRLFGSRVDDRGRGGDIDLLVDGKWAPSESFQRKLRFLVELKSRLGEQRIDVVMVRPGDRRRIVREAAREGIEL